jgi:phage N-6-adenine-methyltransferase
MAMRMPVGGAGMNNIALAERPDDLPTLIDRASARLTAARSSAEVLEAKKLADMALHLAKVTKAANETHADCLRIITRAEMRMADEVDRARELGEIARKNQPVSQYVQASDIPATLGDLGIDRRRVAEWSEIRDAGPEVVEGAIAEALDEGRAPSKADITRHVRGTFGTGENEWYTPKDHLAAAREALGAIDLDPASSAIAQQEVRAADFFDKETNGLVQEWRGNVWLNPPYAQPLIAQFVAKMVEEYQAGRVNAGIMLTHNYTDTAWFHQAASAAKAICFTRGRIRFYDPEGNLASPTQGQAFFYFGDEPERFASAFTSVGFVVAPCKA